MNNDQDEQKLQTRVYHIWEAAGRPDGDHESHWHQARAELDVQDPSHQPDRPGQGETDNSSSGNSSNGKRAKR